MAIQNRDEMVPTTDVKVPGPRKYILRHSMVFIMTFYHVSALYGLYLCFYSARWATIWLIPDISALLLHSVKMVLATAPKYRELENLVLHVAAVWGITAGAHRLWSHRAYKAKLPLQIILMLFNCIAHQKTICYWARDHRIHHKYSDTDADPHNATRGLFYSHIGWLLVEKHPDAIRRGREVDMSDLFDNPVLQFQNKYYLVLSGLLTFVLPTLIPMFFWQETLNSAHHISILRLVIGFNIAFSINSAAHKYGNKPYDKNILATQSIPLSLASLGECFHNYHHTFPWDYKTAELGNNYFNLTSKLIDFFAWIGWAYDLRSASEGMVLERVRRSGDGTDLWGRNQGSKFS